MSDSAANQKAKSRSRLRRKAASAPAFVDAEAAANDACALDTPAPANDAIPEPAAAARGAIIAFRAELDDHALPPFDPPDAGDIFGSPDVDDDPPPPANDAEDVAIAHAYAEVEEESVAAEEVEPLELNQVVAETPAPPRRDLMEIDEDLEDVFVNLSETMPAEAAPEDVLELHDEVFEEEDALEQEEAHLFVAAAPAEEDAPALETEAIAVDLSDDEAIPFDPPDEEEGGFRSISIEETMGVDGELLLREPPAVDEAVAKGGLSRTPRAEPRNTDQPVPAIAIHVSWDRPDIARQLEALAGDRRFARAEITSERGGVQGAVNHCKHERPDLLILDTTLRNGDMLAALDRLGDVIAAGAKVIVVGAVNDITPLRELAARGVAEYVVPPFNSDELVRTVCGLFAETDNARVVAVLGARGGVGASTIAQNVAWIAAERQQLNTVLVDLDLPFGAAAFDFQKEAQHTVADIVKAADLDDALDRAACAVGDRLRLFAAPATPACDLELDAPSVDAFIAAVRRASPFVVLDLPHHWSDGVKQALLRADDVVIVSTPDLASLRNTDNILRHLRTVRDKDFAPIVALSMVGVPKRPEITLKDFTEAVSVAPLMSFAYDPALHGMCAAQGQTVFQAAPRSKTAISLDALATLLTGREPTTRKKKAHVVKPANARALEAAPVAAEPAPAPVAEQTPAPEVELAPQADAPLACAEQADAVEAVADESAAVAELIDMIAGEQQGCEPEPSAFSADDWLVMFGSAPAPVGESDAAAAEPVEQAEAQAELTLELEAPTEQSAQPEPPVEDLPLIALDAAPRAADALLNGRRLYKLPATRDDADQPPRRRSTGLVRMAATFIAAIGLVSWYVEQRREPAQAAEPQLAAPSPPPAAAAAAAQLDPALSLAAQYQRALDTIAAGDNGEGVTLLRRLADSGFPMAQYRLAKLYEQGQIARADLELARQWTERAAHAGNVQAMHDLGVFFSRDETAPRDETAAFRWFRQAADYGLADSQFNLGVMYQQGRGVTADPGEALFWFMLAAAHNDAAAAERVATLTAAVTPMQLEQARARAEAFRPRTPEPVANGVFEAAAPATASAPAPQGEGVAVAPSSDTATDGTAAPASDTARAPIPPAAEPRAPEARR